MQGVDRAVDCNDFGGLVRFAAHMCRSDGKMRSPLGPRSVEISLLLEQLLARPLAAAPTPPLDLLRT